MPTDKTPLTASLFPPEWQPLLCPAAPYAPRSLMTQPSSLLPHAARRSPAVASHLRAQTEWERVGLLSEGRYTRTYRVRPINRYSDACGEFTLKVPRYELAPRDRGLAEGLLLREAEVSRQVAHPHLASTLALELTTEGPSLVQAFQPTTALPRFALGQPLTVKLWLVRQVAEGLAALHRHGWLHGCVSASAIEVAPQGRATLGELGWARRRHSDECDQATAPFLGDLRYAAPESLDGHGRLSEAADVYALGTLLFELVAGRCPFHNYAGPELVAAKRLLPSPELRQLAPGAPLPVACLLKGMLQRDPLRRPALTEVIESLVAAEIQTFVPHAQACAA
jgi:serine/threonine protein kinase